MNDNENTAGVFFFLLAAVFFFLWRGERKKRITLERHHDDRLFTAVTSLSVINEDVAVKACATYEIMKRIGEKAGV